ncbi:MAG: GldG family protein [Acidobacteriota bacterium]|nr:GldG family protein [Acidobacteriota bacterium]
MKRFLYAAWPFGLALLVVGVGWGVMASRVMPVAYQALIGLGLLLSAAGLWGGRAFLFDRVGGKRVRFGAGFLLSAVVGLLIVLLINFISARYHQRWDLTRTRSFSLHPATLRVLEKISGDVDVYAFFPERNALEFRAVKELYGTFVFHQPKIHLTMADPNQRPDLLSEAGVSGNRMTVVKYGERVSYFPGYGEDKLVAALMEVARDEPKVVYWVIGHGERSVDAQGGEGYLRLQSELTKNFLQLRTISLGPGEPVPGDASLLVLADPRRPVGEKETALYDAYLRAGGRLLALVDADFKQADGQPHPLAGLLERWGIRAMPAVVIDARESKLADYPEPLTVIADRFGVHETVQGLEGQRVLMNVVRPVEFSQVMSDQQIFHHVLLRAGRGTYVESDLERAGRVREIDPQALEPWLDRPPVLAVAAFRKYTDERDPGDLGRVARMVVVGDADFLKDDFFDALSNSELAMNLVRWLTGEEVLIRRQGEAKVAKLAMQIEPGQRRLVRMIVVLEALGIFLVGWIVWFFRRTR